MDAVEGACFTASLKPDESEGSAVSLCCWPSDNPPFCSHFDNQ